MGKRIKANGKLFFKGYKKTEILLVGNVFAPFLYDRPVKLMIMKKIKGIGTKVTFRMNAHTGVEVTKMVSIK